MWAIAITMLILKEDFCRGYTGDGSFYFDNTSRYLKKIFFNFHFFYAGYFRSLNIFWIFHITQTMFTWETHVLSICQRGEHQFFVKIHSTLNSFNLLSKHVIKDEAKIILELWRYLNLLLFFTFFLLLIKIFGVDLFFINRFVSASPVNNSTSFNCKFKCAYKAL